MSFERNLASCLIICILNHVATYLFRIYSFNLEPTQLSMAFVCPTTHYFQLECELCWHDTLLFMPLLEQDASTVSKSETTVHS